MRRGSTLIAVLLLSTLLTVLGMAMVVVGNRASGAGRDAVQAQQARLLAESGIEDAVQKLSKDPEFPPIVVGREQYTYAEEVRTSAGLVGSYEVAIDVTRRAAPVTSDPNETATYKYPNYTVQIASTGVAGRTTAGAEARHRILAELDVSPKRRDVKVSGGMQPWQADYYTNPGYFRFIRWEDDGAF